MRTFGRILTVLVMIVIVLVLAAAAGFLYISRRPFPQIGGSLRVAGLQNTVTVIRDKWGVPHLYADNSRGLVLAQGYVTSQDRFWQMEFWRRIGAGRLSEILGKATLTNDLFIRAIGWRRASGSRFQIAGARRTRHSPMVRPTVSTLSSTHIETTCRSSSPSWG